MTGQGTCGFWVRTAGESLFVASPMICSWRMTPSCLSRSWVKRSWSKP